MAPATVIGYNEKEGCIIGDNCGVDTKCHKENIFKCPP
jgi:hypothetical protein